MPRGDLDLDVDSPEEVAEILRNAAREYEEATLELESAWQEKEAGKIWGKIAKILEQAAAKIEKIV